MKDADERAPYQVRPEGAQFQVVDEEGRLVFVCGNVANAEQYAVVMNEAYGRGYRAGARASRQGRGVSE